MANIWLHRISHCAEVSYPLLERNQLTIGFSDFANQEFIDTASDQTIFQNYFIDYWGFVPRNKNNLYRFIFEMKKDDLILVPGSGVFSIYKIVGDNPKPIGQCNLDNLVDWQGNIIFNKEDKLHKENIENSLIDLGFFWDVEPLHLNISRYEFADSALTSRMKILQTNALITNLKESIDSAIVAFNSNKPINLYSKIVESSAKNILEVIRKELNPDKFEQLIKWYFHKVGASEVFIPSKNEADKNGDSDINVSFEQIRTIIYIQAKFHTGETNEWAVQQINEYAKNKENTMDDGYSRSCWVISSCDNFSEACINLAKEQKVHLVNGSQFAIMLLEAGISNLDKIK